MFNFCRHKLGKVETDGYQYCQKCGRAVKVECNHKWTTIQTLEKHDAKEMLIGLVYILQCFICGEIKEFRVER